jgi:hypothetical protein
MKVALTLLLAAALVIPTTALGGTKNKKAHKGASEQVHVDQVPVALITVTERTIIFDYVHQYHYAFVPPPGSGRPLPAGIAKKLARGGHSPSWHR